MRPVLITSGATRNPIDAMRYISAYSSGRTGAHINMGLGMVDTLLLGSPEACHEIPDGFPIETYGDTLDLLARMHRWVLANPRGIVVHAAAVGDYMLDPADASATTKRPSGQDQLHITLVPTPKIVDQIAQWSPDVFLVSFKAAAPGTTEDELQRLAHAQLQRTRSELVFANTIGQLESGVTLVSRDLAVVFPSRDNALDDLIARVHAARST